MGSIKNWLFPATQSDSLETSQRDQERKALQTIIATLQEEIEKLKSESLEMVGRMGVVAASREEFSAQVSSLIEVNTSRQRDIKSLRAEVAEAKDKYDQLIADSNAEKAALHIRLLDLETQNWGLKEILVVQEMRISKLERRDSNSPRSLPQAEDEVTNPTLTTPSGSSQRRLVGEREGDRWLGVGRSTPRSLPKAGDLSNFGKINKFGSIVIDPSDLRAGKKDAAKRDSTLTGVNSSSNIFAILDQDGEATPEIGLQPNWPSSRRTNVGFGVGGTPGPQRKKLQFFPRSKHVGIGANKRIAEDVEEFFSARNIDESEEYFKKLPSGHHHRLVDKLVSKAIESKEADGKLVADAFARATEKNLCSISSLEEGFLPTAELLDDTVIDAPKAFQIMATMMKGAGLDKDEERRVRIARKSMDSDRLLELLA